MNSSVSANPCNAWDWVLLKEGVWGQASGSVVKVLVTKPNQHLAPAWLPLSALQDAEMSRK